MPQVFSAGWLYLFIVIMAVSIVRIFFKIRTIHRESPMDRPVIKVPPIAAPVTEVDDGTQAHPLLREPDELIRQGDYGGAVKLLDGLARKLSEDADREILGRVLFRTGACHRRLAEGNDRFQHLLRGGEALREAVRLFAPARFRSLYLRTMDELADLYEDMAGEKNPVEYLNQAARTCQTAARAAGEDDLIALQASFLARTGDIQRRLSSHGSARVHLQDAAIAFEEAGSLLADQEDADLRTERVRILRQLGETWDLLSAYGQTTLNLQQSAQAYEDALAAMEKGGQLEERSAVLTDAGRVLLKLYDEEKSPAHLHRVMRYMRDAVEAAKGEPGLVQRGLATAVMADSLTRYAEVKNSRENLERAARLYETVLGILRGGVAPQERERVKKCLAETVQKISGAGEEAHGRGGQET